MTAAVLTVSENNPNGSAQPQVTGQSVSVLTTSCGEPEGSVESRVRFDEETGALTVGVGVEADDGICQECTGEIEYRARISFASGLPDTVYVEHDGTVAEESG